MKKVKLAVIGTGGIGCQHLQSIGELENIELVAVCDSDSRRVNEVGAKYDCKAYTDHGDLIDSGICDAVLIATPHYSHTTIGIDTLKAGLHVLVEKPISVHKIDCKRLIRARQNNGQVFAAMFNQRTEPPYKKLKQLIDEDQLGEIIRVTWIITSWFRPQIYYDSNSWRATWEGEGGGVLLNQCPHQLDLLQWFFGMPVKVRGFCGLGKRHKIQVEDEVTAYLEYRNGATGIFITSTGEFPGTNRLEIVADMGKIVAEDKRLSFTQTEIPVSEFSRTATDIWATPNTRDIEISANENPGQPGQHGKIIQNFANAILYGEKLIAPAEEGIHSVELANAILYSSLTDKTVELPLDSQAYERMLQQLIKDSNKEQKCI